MKTKEILAKKSEDLVKELRSLYEKLAQLRMDVALRKEKNPQSIKAIKKDIARINTVLNERKIIEEQGIKK